MDKNRHFTAENVIKMLTQFFFPPGDVDLFCSANPRAVVKDLDNCAHFINCSHKNSDLGKFYQECTYPDLFSDVTMKCESFQAVSCKHRPEPQAPCKAIFQLNLRKLLLALSCHTFC